MEDFVTVIINYIGSFENILERYNIDGEDLGQGFGIVKTGLGRVDELLGDGQVIYYELPRNLAEVEAEAGGGIGFEAGEGSCIEQAWSRGLTGKGVILGVIDSGLDFTHSDFRKDDGSTRVLYLWDISRKDVSGIIEPGIEYNAEEINGLLESGVRGLALDESGHGTATAGAMGGNGKESGGRFKGVAYDGEFVVVKVSSNQPVVSVDIMRGINYIFQKSEELGMPAVINISYGTSNGSHGGLSLFETYINRIADAGRLVIAAAAGNEGAAGHHYTGKVENGQVYEVKLNVVNELGYIYLAMWKSFVDKMNFELILPDGRTTGVLPYNGGSFRFDLDGVRVGADIGRPVPYASAQEIFFFAGDFYNVLPKGEWALKIFGEDIVDGTFNIWLPVNELISENTFFDNSDREVTITLPATALNVLAVGAYDSAAGKAADFSGRGFLSLNGAKPDVIAPGVNIVAPKAGGGYDSFTGTSIASPICAGAAALFMEWGILRGNDPFMYGQRLKSFLRLGALRDEGISYPNITDGYGRLCIEGAIVQGEIYNRPSSLPL